MAKGTIRRGQIVDTYGVGSLIDVNGEGFVVLDITHWDQNEMIAVDMPRLSKAAGNKKLMTFSGPTGSIPVARFPKWYFCSQRGCRRLVKVQSSMELYSENKNGKKSNLPKTPSCPDCKGAMTPMRWIAYCDHGHLEEIDWRAWCHHSSHEADSGQCSARDSVLRYEVEGQKGGDFDQLIVKCDACQHERSLEGIKTPYKFFGKYVGVWKSDKKCTDRQPWSKYEVDPERNCDAAMAVEPRGSAALYRPKKLSALALGDYQTQPGNLAQRAVEALDELFATLRGKANNNDHLRHDLFEDFESKAQRRIEFKAEDLDIDPEEALAYIQEKYRNLIEGENLELDGEDSQKELLIAEFNMFRQGLPISNVDLNLAFWNPDQKTTPIMSHLIRQVGAVRKLREVRTLLGFTRGKHAEVVPSDLGIGLNWLPAVEAWGEGIYLELNNEFLLKWERDCSDQLSNHAATQLRNIIESAPAQELGIYPDVFFLLAHTLSHLLIRELTFESGYSSSALRERLYFDESDRCCGLLIYTTDSDSEGTLGGLVEQATPSKLESVFNKIANASRWCSLDPVCRETEQQGIGGLNSASCHSCSLISETSCTYQNAGLNRLLLGGLGASSSELSGIFEYIFHLKR